MPSDDQEKAIQSLTAQVVYLRRELVDVMAGHLALLEYVCVLAEKSSGVPGNAAKEYLMGRTQKHRQTFLARIEETDPTLAAFLDTRTADDVEEGLSGE